MSYPFDFDADLAALLAPSEPAEALTQPVHQEAAAAAPDIDLMTLLDPVQAGSGSVPVADDFGAVATVVRQLQETPVYLVELARIAARRAELETHLLDLYQRLDAAQELLKRGLWAPGHVRVAHGLVRSIDAMTMSWRWTETQAWRVARDAGLIQWSRSADWTPFDILEGQRL